ncbi:hypothetical protein [Leucobacter sp. USHLN153]|uniref:hypothetical protein n=1 Tax=Leucobacter sp. USHLN153 TaxID=3081268 RepID=UPI00301B0355
MRRSSETARRTGVRAALGLDQIGHRVVSRTRRDQLLELELELDELDEELFDEELDEELAPEPAFEEPLEPEPPLLPEPDFPEPARESVR